MIVIYTRNIYDRMRRIWNLNDYYDIRIASVAEREEIARSNNCNLTNDVTFLVAYITRSHYAVLDINTVGFLQALMDDLVSEISKGARVYDIKEFYDRFESSVSGYGKYSMDEWLMEQRKKHKKARFDVLAFIWRFVTHDKNTESFRVIEHQFTTGYCYHFALVMKGMFGGKIVCHKNHGHMLWQDKNKVIYDVRGVYDNYIAGDIIPISELGDELENYLHRKGEE
ncbi:MAG: hypothetical protein NC120_09855 [Ruminococcus sp.]|nr:hypothetical protein [Ruminococcus sp.]